MAFDEVRFPDQISFGATGGPKFNTTVIVLESGFEQRNANWTNTRGEWDVAHGLKTQTELDTLIDFFYARRGKARGFRFKDWSDFELDRQNIGTTDSSTAVFQIFKRYTSAAINFDRNLSKIVSGTYMVWVNAVLLTEGGGATQFTIDQNTGKITIGSTHAATSGQAVEAKTEFDVPVRFNTDHLQVNIEFFNRFNWGQIPVIELRI